MGYNHQLSIEQKHWKLSHVTTVSRIAVQASDRETFERRFDRFRCEGPDQVTLFERGGNTPYTYKRASGASSGLLIDQSDPDATNADAQLNLDVLLQYFEENYAFFRAGAVDVDWQQVRKSAQDQLGSDGTPEHLLQVLEQAIRPLRDAHVRITSNDEVIATSLPIQEQTFLMAFAGEAGLDPAIVPRRRIGSAFRDAWRGHVTSQTRAGRAGSALRDQLQWGWLTDGVGYVAAHSFAGLSEGDASPERDFEAMHLAMKSVLRDLREARSIVIDLRFNGGGFDPVALEFVGHFADRFRHAYTKRVWYAGQVVGETRIDVGPSTDRPLNVPLAVLVSDATASGAEIALLALRELPESMFVGQKSRGVLSDTLLSKLPNGWTVTISNEIYSTPTGQVFERIGVPVDIETPLTVDGSWKSALQATVRTALKALARTRCGAGCGPDQGGSRDTYLGFYDPLDRVTIK